MCSPLGLTSFYRITAVPSPAARIIQPAVGFFISKMAAVRAKMNQGIKLSKGERKILKKQNKAFQTFKTKVQEVGEISHCPTPYLLVKNGGLMCGVKRQDILGVFQKYGTLEDLVMLPGKSYCYVLYSSLKNAEKAVMDLNGRKLLNEMSLCGTILYLAYLTKKPCLHLCTLDQTYPSGMILVEDFIDETEESVLLECFSNCEESKDMTLTDPETSGKSSPLSGGGNVTLHIRACYIYGLGAQNSVVT